MIKHMDVIGFTATVLSFLVLPQTATLLAPYAVIIGVALFASMIALGASNIARSTAAAALFIFTAVGMAFFLTASVAQLIAARFNMEQAALLVPVAIAIAGSRDYWVRALLWVANFYMRMKNSALPPSVPSGKAEKE
jgi:hypothetical protein